METIKDILAYETKHRYNNEEGYMIVTDQQTITLAIDNGQSCCERWGYFMTEDKLDKFRGAKLTGVKVTDTNRSTKQFIHGWDAVAEQGKEQIHLDDGDVMFVDIQTDRGPLQFVAYNCNNGYYGHRATIRSHQLTKEVGL